MSAESSSIATRHASRSPAQDAELYDPLGPAVLMSTQERERALCDCLRRRRPSGVQNLRVLEIGCGSGRMLLELIRLGFRPENITGNDLLPARIEAARALLPQSVKLISGDAIEAPLPQAAFDIVLQSTVFTSILDSSYQELLARRMWSYATESGSVLWYDFIYNNPRNPDVKGVLPRRVRRLFPGGSVTYSRFITLAPPISRRVTRIHPSLYTAFNFFPFLRTHYLCWIEKQRTIRD